MNYQCVATNNDKWLIERVFRGKTDGFFVEAGAADGLVESSTYWLEKVYKWSGLLVEPEKFFYETLKTHRTTTCVNKALYDINGAVKFVASQNKYYSGVSETLVDWHKDECYKDGYETYGIECVTIGSLLKQYNAPNHINLIALDTEGSEHKILATFPFSEYTVDIFIVEMSNWSSRDILLNNGYVEINNEFNTKSPWEHYFASEQFKKNNFASS